MEIKKITDKAFADYGTVLTIDSNLVAELNEVMAENAIPEAGNVYIADDAKFDNKAVKNYFTEQFGDMPVQMGFCNGKGNSMDALEYHKSAENIYAVTDLLLLLGKAPLVNGRYNSADLECFYVEAGTLVEINPLVLHYAPIRVSESGFKATIVLPKGTNYDLKIKDVKDKKLFATNKWLIAHKDSNEAKSGGAVEGIDGENIVIEY